MDNKIYCSFCILGRTSNKHQKIHKFLKEKELETKMLNTYYDEHVNVHGILFLIVFWMMKNS